MIRGILIPGMGDKSAAFAIRREVFIEEQGFSEQTEFDCIDDIALHVLVIEDGVPAATARLYQQNGQYHIGRVAVLKANRGRGLGDMAMRMLMLKAGELGAKEVALGAQTQAEGFYRRLGFLPTGEQYDDEGVPHIMMKEALAQPACCGGQCKTDQEI